MVYTVQDLNPVGREQAMIAASLPANQSKNRFINILPYDSTRVKLVTAADAPEGADYINGNWLQVKRRPNGSSVHTAGRTLDNTGVYQYTPTRPITSYTLQGAHSTTLVYTNILLLAQ